LIFLEIFVRRGHILEDTLKQFETSELKEFIFNSKIEFVKEPGVDAGICLFAMAF